MTKKHFEELCKQIRQRWTRKEALLVILNNGSQGDTPMSLCVGSYSNQAIIAENCVLWDNNDTKVYEGVLLSETLRELLKRHKICHGEITNIRLLEHNAKGTFHCFKDKDKCRRNRTCNLCEKK